MKVECTLPYACPISSFFSLHHISMKSPSFLSLVAADLRRRFGTDMSRVAVVFPGKRAALFFGEHLLPQNDASPAEAAVRAPRYFSIDDLYHTLPGEADHAVRFILGIHTYYEDQWLDRGITIKYLKFSLPQQGTLVEPDVEIEMDTYRSYNRSKRSARPTGR